MTVECYVQKSERTACIVTVSGESYSIALNQIEAYS